MKFGIISIFTVFALMTPLVYAEPVLRDDDFIVQKFVSGFCCGPTTMAFEGDDILVLERFDGKVRLVRDGMLQEKPILDENVNSSGEQGMLGITTVGTKVYLYFTESEYDGGPPVSKRVYSYDWNGHELVNKTLVKDLPQTRTYHNGGAMITDLEGSVYLVVGDTGRYGKLQNHPQGEPNDTSVILRIAPTGPYYAIGIRNSFGLAIDPVTGELWDTENGDDNFDEINLVQENFNSGWEVIMGPSNATTLSKLPGYQGYVYHDPQFSWEGVVAPTGLTFVNSEPFGKYRNDLFVLDCIYGNLYKFELNQNRDGFVFDSAWLSDNVANKGESIEEIIFGTGFGCATDIEVGPDGLLYIVSHSHGTIYRIIPKSMISESIIDTNLTWVQYAVYISIAIIAAFAVSIVIFRKRLIKHVPPV